MTDSRGVGVLFKLDRSRALLRGIVGATLLPLAAFLLQMLIWPILAPHSWVLYFPTIFAASCLGGAVSGAGATLVSAALDWWFFVPPHEVLIKDDANHLVGLAIFVLLGLAVTWYQGRLRTADRARAAALVESERNVAQLKQLVHQRAVFTALIENSSDFIGIADARGTPLYINPAGRRMVGLSPEFPVESTQLADYYSAHRRSFASETIVKAMHEQGRLEGETCFRHWQTGHEIPVSYTHFMIREPQTGQTLGMATITREITEIKRIRDQLEASTRKQQFLAEAGEILVSTLDYKEILTRLVHLIVRDFADLCCVDVFDESDGHGVRRVEIVSRDPSLEWACEILRGAPPGLAQRQLVSSVVMSRQPLLMETVSHDLAASFAEDDPERLRAIRAINPRSAITVPLLAQGKVIGLLALASSTASRYGEREVRVAEALALRAAMAIENARLYASAQQALQARDEVLGIVAHDLRNPLTAITVHSELLRMRRSDQRWRDDVQAIQRSAQRMERMIQDLLDVASAEAGCLKVDRRAISASELITESVRAHQRLASLKPLTLRLNVPQELPEIWADHYRLLQVFENLLGNALKFTEPGGVITIEASHTGGDILFCVSDTGAGINPEALPHVFDRFWQARQGERRGAGLGLAIAKAIVGSHGGRIWVESTVGHGTRFFFTIPTAPERVDHSEYARAVQ